MNKKYYIRTFGCQMNQADSAYLTAFLDKAGYRKADRPEEADIIIFNTCSVREHAEERLFQNLQDTGLFPGSIVGLKLGAYLPDPVEPVDGALDLLEPVRPAVKVADRYLVRPQGVLMLALLPGQHGDAGNIFAFDEAVDVSNKPGEVGLDRHLREQLVTAGMLAVRRLEIYVVGVDEHATYVIPL